jgi:predicted RNA-binding protein YlqC (UPF0109 family)
MLPALHGVRHQTPPAPDTMSKPSNKRGRSRAKSVETDDAATEFMELMNKDVMELMSRDIRDLEIARSLRKLGSCKVMEWDFRDVLPAVNKLAHQEVDIAGFLKRTAHYKVMEWDFRSMLHSENNATGDGGRVMDPEQMQALILRLKDFLQYAAANLIDAPEHAQIKVSELSPGVLNFKLVMMKRDVAMLIGTEGHTAAAIRNMMKAVAARHGVHLLLRIHSHEEETAIAFDRKNPS